MSTNQEGGCQQDGSSFARLFPLGTGPLLRRAFSIAGLRRHEERASSATAPASIDVIYRVVGTATRWMQSLQPGNDVSVLGPLGNAFPIHSDKPVAWLVAGGVGLPPMLWLAEAMHAAGKKTVAFCGAQTADLLALTINPTNPPDTGATRATRCADEFTRHNTGVIISTDDGSLGYAGHVRAALETYCNAHRDARGDAVVYCCGPEIMMRSVARFCDEHGLPCYVCMERNMACGLGTCQSCVIPIHEADQQDGWRYRLCCTDGPVFDASTIVW